jgi:hypothetical protein
MITVQTGTVQLSKLPHVSTSDTWWPTVTADIFSPIFCICGPGSSVSIATGYGLDGTGIDSRWGRDFFTRPVRPWGPPRLLYNGYRVFPGVKRAGRGADHPPLLAPRLRMSRAIPLLPSRPLWPVIGWPLPLYILYLIFYMECNILMDAPRKRWQRFDAGFEPTNLNTRGQHANH